MRKKIAAIALAVWLSVICYLMLIAERFDLSLFFVLGFIGFLVIVELMEPHYVKPRSLWYTRALIAVGIVIFVAVVVQKVLDIFGLELVLA